MCTDSGKKETRIRPKTLIKKKKINKAMLLMLTSIDVSGTVGAPPFLAVHSFACGRRAPLRRVATCPDWKAAACRA